MAAVSTFGCSPALVLNASSPSSAAAAAAATSGSAVGGGRSVSDIMVHPIVLLSVLDHHTRRQEGAGRVIGTLLGRRDGNRVRFIVFMFCHLVLEGGGGMFALQKIIHVDSAQYQYLYQKIIGLIFMCVPSKIQ